MFETDSILPLTPSTSSPLGREGRIEFLESVCWIPKAVGQGMASAEKIRKKSTTPKAHLNCNSNFQMLFHK
jgi:hypothetical protein